MPKVVGIFAVPGVQLLDVSAPLDVFAQANAECGRPFYALRIIASESGPIRSSSGAQLLPDWIVPDIPERIDTLLVAGAPSAGRVTLRTDVLAWLRSAAVQSKRYGSICTGAFILAATGLLKGRRLTTHWAAADALTEAYPSLAVDADALYVRDGKLRTGAGVTAGLDLALALVEEDLGRATALDVARELVVFLKRPGGQAQFSAMLSMQCTDDRFGELHAWMAEHLTADLSVPALAERVRMSERSFVRHYRAGTGRTPARAVEQIRVEAAQRLLGETAWPVKRIAARCGFGSEETLRRSFVRVLGVSPQGYRERFVR